MFDKDRFIQGCIKAIAEGHDAVHELVAEAISDGDRVMSQLGAPQHAGLSAIYRSPELTIINFAWAPCMSLMPHNHQMFSVVGIYCGREDNIFWRRKGASIEAVGAQSLGVGDATILDKSVIHSVLNPIGKMTCALHVYGGDFFAPDEPRSEWDHETLVERPWNVERVKTLFAEAEARYPPLIRLES